MKPDEPSRDRCPEDRDWGVTMSNGGDRGPVETVRVASRGIWESRDQLFEK